MTRKENVARQRAYPREVGEIFPLNSKSDMLDADIPKRLPQHPVASALGIEPTEEEIATAMKAMANAKRWDWMVIPQNC